MTTTGSPSALREFRYKAKGASQSEVFLNAAHANWVPGTDDTVKLRVVAFDDSGLTQEGLPDETLQTRLRGKPAPFAGLRKGSMKFSVHLPGRASNTTPPQATLIQQFTGAIWTPTNAAGAVVGAGTMSTTNVALASANTYTAVGAAVLVGTRGDARGSGEVKIVSSVDAGGIQFTSACRAAPAAADALVFGTTVYCDETAAMAYIDTLSVGHNGNDQRQTIGAAGTFGISGTGIGEIPKIDVDLMVSDHRWVPTDEQTSFVHATSPDGSDPAYQRGTGMLQIWNTSGDTARAVYSAGEITINPGLVIEEIPDPLGPNGVGGFCRMPGAATAEMTVIHDSADMPGMVDDFEDQVEKSLLLQFGHEIYLCAAIDMPNVHLTKLPEAGALNGLSGVKIGFEADDNYTAGSELASSPIRFHFF